MVKHKQLVAIHNVDKFTMQIYYTITALVFQEYTLSFFNFYFDNVFGENNNHFTIDKEIEI